MREKNGASCKARDLSDFSLRATAFYQTHAGFDEDAQDLIGSGSERSGHRMAFGLCRAAHARTCRRIRPAIARCRESRAWWLESLLSQESLAEGEQRSAACRYRRSFPCRRS